MESLAPSVRTPCVCLRSRDSDLDFLDESDGILPAILLTDSPCHKSCMRSEIIRSEMVDYIKNPSELQKESHVDTLIVIGTAKGYADHLHWVCDEILPILRPIVSRGVTSNNNYGAEEAPKAKKMKLDSDSRIDLIRSIAGALQPSPDSPVSTEHWFVGGLETKDIIERGQLHSTTSKPLKIVLGALPPSVSRHNSPGQPHGIVNLLKKHYRPKESTVVVTLCEQKDYVLSSACAIARVGGISYQRKSGGTYGLVLNGKTENPETRETSSPIPTVKSLFPYALTQAELDHFSHISEGIRLTRRLVDAPCNDLHTDAFVEEALSGVKDLPNVTTRVIKGKELQSKGFGGLYGVGKAASHPPAMVILMYNPEGSSGVKPTVMVGKGIVYDTGGLSMKSPASMLGMKRDMGGAGAILSAFICAAKSGIRKPFHAVLCIAENAVGPTATRPDDVHTLYSGKTVEINNTDAVRAIHKDEG